LHSILLDICNDCKQKLYIRGIFKMKRFLVVVIAVVMLVGTLAACGADKATTEAAKSTVAEATKSTEVEAAKTTEAEATKSEATQEASAAASKYKDGVYKVAYDNFDSRGWKAFVELEIKGDKITSVKFDSVTKDGKFKTQDAEYKKAMEKKGTYPEKYSKELQDKLLEKQDIAAVDAVTSATTSSNDFKALVEYALKEMAPNGVTEEKTIPLPKA
jgi:major membrane immunogen (membrane-anchored lipoprotein)